ncbi:hypothetical protein ONZ45_g6681 [Pleurotus djamor]|nr:hypothetical protein ONZ45_g6681 [Pleurotus djamor]
MSSITGLLFGPLMRTPEERSYRIPSYIDMKKLRACDIDIFPDIEIDIHRKRVVDASSGYIVIKGHPFFDEVTTPIHFTLIFEQELNPTAPLSRNTAMASLMHSTLPFQGNVVVFAHDFNGLPKNITNADKALLHHLMPCFRNVRNVKTFFTLAAQNFFRARSPLTLTLPTSTGFVQPTLPLELLCEITTHSDIGVLASLARTTHFLRMTVQNAVRARIINSIAPFVAGHVGTFFSKLEMVNALQVAVPVGQAHVMALFFQACGYYVVSEDNVCPRQASQVILLSSHQKTVTITESTSNNAVCPVLAQRNTAAMNILTPHSLISPYTNLLRAHRIVAHRNAVESGYEVHGLRYNHLVELTCNVYITLQSTRAILASLIILNDANMLW